MTQEQSLHSICRWTFHGGRGGFVPEKSIPEWNPANLDTVGVVRLIKEEIAPRIPANIVLGMELHYDYEVNEENVEETASAMVDNGVFLAMITPGAHRHFAYGGVASLDPREREAAEGLNRRTVDLAYGPLRRTWNPDPALSPTLVLWNGSYGYDMATVGVREMYARLKESVADLCRYEERKGGAMFLGIEPKPNEGHPAMLLPTVASAALLWRKLAEESGLSLSRKGINLELGHSQMIGLDYVYDTVEEIENDMLVHMHLNSQGYDNGITLGGPGKFDIDMGFRANGMNLAIAGLLREAAYRRWKGHDIQPRPYDGRLQAVDRVVRSILSWEACSLAEREMDYPVLMECLASRRTAKAEDVIVASTTRAFEHFDRLYASDQAPAAH